MNIGFTEAQLLQERYRCFIFHDVDVVPEHDGNLYNCPEDGHPRQITLSLDYSEKYRPFQHTHVVLNLITTNSWK